MAEKYEGTPGGHHGGGLAVGWRPPGSTMVVYECCGSHVRPSVLSSTWMNLRRTAMIFAMTTSALSGSGCREVECPHGYLFIGNITTCVVPCDGPCPRPDIVRPSIIQQPTPTDYHPAVEWVRLSPETITVPQVRFSCGGATQVPLVATTRPQAIFRSGEWYVQSTGNGASTRWNRSTNMTQLLSRPPTGDPLHSREFPAFLGPSGDAVAAMLLQPEADRPVGASPEWAYLTRFSEFPLAGRVLRQQRFAGPAGGTINEFVSTTRLMAWVETVHVGVDYRLWVAGPNGENAHEIEQTIPGAHQPAFVHADGANLVWMFKWDIFLWNADRQVVENLTNDSAAQWMPWIDGDRVVWVDQRDNPTGTFARMDNPEIYLFDLRTRERRRITHDPVDRPAQQRVPTIAGDWITWVDYREAQNPNPPGVLSERTGIWGYHLPTGREMPLHRGDFHLQNPRMIDNEVFFGCISYSENASGGFVIPLPSMPPSGG